LTAEAEDGINMRALPPEWVELFNRSNNAERLDETEAVTFCLTLSDLEPPEPGSCHCVVRIDRTGRIRVEPPSATSEGTALTADLRWLATLEGESLSSIVASYLNAADTAELAEISSSAAVADIVRTLNQGSG
jgi:hypothetical protein